MMMGQSGYPARNRRFAIFPGKGCRWLDSYSSHLTRFSAPLSSPLSEENQHEPVSKTTLSKWWVCSVHASFNQIEIIQQNWIEQPFGSNRFSWLCKSINYFAPLWLLARVWQIWVSSKDLGSISHNLASKYKHEAREEIHQQIEYFHFFPSRESCKLPLWSFLCSIA